MNDVTISILIVGAVILIALVVVYFGLVRRRRELVGTPRRYGMDRLSKSKCENA